ncbi:SAM-dependent methyltransferase [Deinococcus arenicola]|uniref:SAM-dependent methyltransferase n=1 Tax=Deinococcus arenicola TaxID=2994950 RepID=A0ABU4DWG0_9DEIO|nr:SAM-dependent methyltransferase [Deinococcus sp. ZS9-10]MDV6376220.1 SAM-dependent methyltransferase [Deinococcus sp. ZS9-10]
MTLPEDYFEDVYRAREDPWDFATSLYEAAKYARTLAALPRGHYVRALEIGCSIGVLSGLLAERVDTLWAVDLNDQALTRARVRNADRANIIFERRRLPDDLPNGLFDLIVLSEVLYYLSPEDLETALDAILGRLSADGTLLLVHWTPHVHDYPQTGDAVHAATIARLGHGLRHLHAERYGDDQQGYRLDVFAQDT